jgi:hypothetical protein
MGQVCPKAFGGGESAENGAISQKCPPKKVKKQLQLRKIG